MVNERPLCPAPDEAQQLTLIPAHFLHAQFRPFVFDFDATKLDLTKMTPTARDLVRFWNDDAANQRRVWQEWKHSYLVYLRDRVLKAFCNAYRTITYTPKVGEVVIVQDMATKPGQYKLAKIVHLHESPDGNIRRADIEFPDGRTTSRPLKFLAPFEFQAPTEAMEQLQSAATCQSEAAADGNPTAAADD